MKKIIIIFHLLLGFSSANSQNVKLSCGLGEINQNTTYGDIINAFGEPDSIHGYTKPIGKSLPRYELFYDGGNLIIYFYLSPFEKLTKKTANPEIYLFNNSIVELNDLLLSKMDTALIIEKFGIPEDRLKSSNELVLGFKFQEKKYFSLLDFYFNLDGTINKIRLIFGKY